MFCLVLQTCSQSEQWNSLLLTLISFSLMAIAMLSSLYFTEMRQALLGISVLSGHMSWQGISRWTDFLTEIANMTTLLNVTIFYMFNHVWLVVGAVITISTLEFVFLKLNNLTLNQKLNIKIKTYQIKSQNQTMFIKSKWSLKSIIKSQPLLMPATCLLKDSLVGQTFIQVLHCKPGIITCLASMCLGRLCLNLDV